MNAVRRSPHLVAVLLIAAACTAETVAPPVPETEIVAIGPELGATAGQASLPGLTMVDGSTAAGPTADCAWDAAVSRVVCAPVVRNGLTVERSFAFYDAAGNAQPRRDAATRSMNTRVHVAGSVTVDRGTMTVDRNSTLTVSGLERGSTTHTLNGVESGTVSGTRRTDRGAFTSTETFEASTRTVVVPVPRTSTSWPLSGTTERRSTVTAAREGSTESRTASFGHTVTFNGTSQVPVTITHNGVSRSCTLDLATRRTTCS